jgi:hypothetical protein
MTFLGAVIFLFGIIASKFSRRIAEAYARTFGETLERPLFGTILRLGGAFLILFGIGLMTGIVHN